MDQHLIAKLTLKGVSGGDVNDISGKLSVDSVKDQVLYKVIEFSGPGAVTESQKMSVVVSC